MFRIYTFIFLLFLTPIGAWADHVYFFYMSGDAIEFYGDRKFRDHLLEVFQNAKGHSAVILYDSVELEPIHLDFIFQGKPIEVVDPKVFTKSVNEKCYPDLPLPYRSSGEQKEMAINMGCKYTAEAFVGLGNALKAKGLIRKGDHFHFFGVGHGSAWKGFGADFGPEALDENEKPSSLSIFELRDALAKIKDWSDSRWSSLSFNACLMGSLEVAYHFREVIQYLFAPSWPVPIVGSDFFDHREQMEKEGASLREIFQRLIVPYPYYLDYHFKFDEVVKLKDPSTTDVLKTLAKSRVLYEGEDKKNDQKIVRVTREGESAFNILRDNPDLFVIDDVKFELSAENNLILDVQELVRWRDAFVERISRPLQAMFQKLALDYFSASRLIDFTDNDLDMKLVSWVKFLNLLLEVGHKDGDEAETIKKYFDLKDLENFVREFRRLFTTGLGFGENRVAGYSLFLPHEQFWHADADLDNLNPNKNEDSNRKTALRLMDRLEFFKDFEWRLVHDAYVTGLGNRQKEVVNEAEYEVGRKWME